MSKRLLEILNGLDYQAIGVLPETVSEISLNSQALEKGALFFAIRGAKDDGHKYVPGAAQKGAAAAVVEEPISECGIPQIKVQDTKVALSRAAANFYGNPTAGMRVIGVTGTNGKTTIVYLLNEIFKEAGLRRGTVGTLGYSLEDERCPLNLTTPDSLQLHQIFRLMADRRVETAAMEVSSHSLSLHRVDDIHFSAGVFTNISQDHLDFHSTLDEYAVAKSKLFKIVENGGFVVNNVDDKYANLFRQAAHTKIVTYALQNQADVHWAVGVTSSDGIRGTIVTPFANITVVSRLSGEFNLKNILAAVATAINLNINDKIIAAALARVQSVPGRLQEIVQPGPARVFVDYAHTPDAIINVLQTLRTMLTSNGRLIAIFGCGGNRDRTKRPKMAQAVESLADLAIVTTDNPRFEEPETIIADAIQGFSTGYKYLKITDRKEAITETLKLARPGDIIAILGKGHETYQEIRGVRTPFYDGEIVEKYYGGQHD